MLWSKKPQKELTPRMSTLLLAVSVIILVAAGVLLWRQNGFDKGNVRIGEDISLAVDVAATAQTRERGLSGRERLDDDQGMLFFFTTKQRYAFWMKGMRIPIDILWIDDGKIVDISVNVPIPDPGGYLATYSPTVPVDTVLEVSAGFADRNQIMIGTPVTYDIDR